MQLPLQREFTFFSQKISTHLLTLLIFCYITYITNKTISDFKKKSAQYEGGIIYVINGYFWKKFYG